MMLRVGWFLALAVLLPAGAATADIAAAVADPTRPAEHRARDVDRRPAAVLAFAFPGPVDGLAVADLVPGGGYYTAILSRMVGEAGRVHAVNPERIFEHFPQAREGFPAYLKEDPRTNVTYSVQRLDELLLPSGLDGAMMVLYYHDMLWTGVDRSEMNRRVFAALKPGGVFLVVDHHAPPGSAEAVSRTLHRMDAAIVLEEVPRAGFEFAGESDILSHPTDPRTASVFDADIRGRTDRFVYLFRKPADH